MQKKTLWLIAGLLVVQLGLLYFFNGHAVVQRAKMSLISLVGGSPANATLSPTFRNASLIVNSTAFPAANNATFRSASNAVVDSVPIPPAAVSDNNASDPPSLQDLNESPRESAPDKDSELHPQCGNWYGKYAQLHAAMHQRPFSQQRIVVFKAECNGMTDRLISAISVFYLAVLTNRQFKIQWESAPPLESTFMQPFVNWTLGAADTDPAHGRVATFAYNRGELLVHEEPVNGVFRSSNLLLLDTDARTWVVTLNQGQTWTLFENPFYKRRLLEMGLRPETAFGCAMRFLFAPRPETIQVMARTWRTVLRHLSPDAFARVPAYIRSPLGITERDLKDARTLIGVQVRFGDEAFRNGWVCRDKLTRDPATRQFFDCAHTLEESIDRNALYYLITDCEPLRVQARQLYPRKIVTFLPRANETHANHHENDPTNPNVQRLAASEWWLFSMTDYQIITRDSSFGRSAAFLSLGWHQVFTMDRQRNGGGQCRFDAFSDWKQLSSPWTRI